MVVIITGHLFTMSIIFNQVFQFHIQHSCLDFVQTAIAACVFKDILFRRTVVGQSTDGLCQSIIVGSRCTAITQGTEVLAWIEAMSCSIPNATRSTAVCMFTTMSLGIVFDKL